MRFQFWLCGSTLAVIYAIVAGIPLVPALLAGLLALAFIVAPAIRKSVLAQQRAVEMSRESRKHLIASYRSALEDATAAGDTDRAARLRRTLVEHEFWG